MKSMSDIVLRELPDDQVNAFQHIRRMLGVYSITPSTVDSALFLQEEKFITDKGLVNKTILELLAKKSSSNASDTLHRIHQNKDLVLAKKDTSYRELLNELKAKQNDVIALQNDIKNKIDYITNTRHRVKGLHEEINKDLLRRDEAFIADICNTGGDTYLGDQFVEIAKGGKFLYTHSTKMGGGNIRHFFVLQDKINITYNDDDYDIDLNMGTYFVQIQMDKENRPLAGNFSNSVRCYGYEDNLTVDGYPHPHVDNDGNICWGDGWDEANNFYMKGDIAGVLDMMYCLLSQYNHDDPYVSITMFDGDDEDFVEKNRNPEASKCRDILSREYAGEPAKLDGGSDERTKCVDSWIRESVSMKKAGHLFSKGDIVYCSDKRLFACVTDVVGTTASMYYLEQLQGISGKIKTDIDKIYPVPSAHIDKLPVSVVTSFTDKHGNEWKDNATFSRADLSGNLLEARVALIIPKYINSTGEEHPLVISERDTGRVIYISPNVNNLKVEFKQQEEV